MFLFDGFFYPQKKGEEEDYVPIKVGIQVGIQVSKNSYPVLEIPIDLFPFVSFSIGTLFPLLVISGK